MVARVAAGLAVAALLVSAAGLAVAVAALVKDPLAPAAPTKDEPGASPRPWSKTQYAATRK